MDSSQPMVSCFGFKSVEIKPQLGKLKWASGSICHPQGMINVYAERISSSNGTDKLDNKTGEGLKANIKLPGDLAGMIEWGGKIIELKPGENEIYIHN